MSKSNKNNAIIIATALIYVIHLVFNFLAGKGGSALFPETTANVSKKFHLEMTPVGATFSIWGFIFLFQLMWIIYAITTTCRKDNAADILSANFFISFNLNILLIVVWLLLWSRQKTELCLAVITLGQLFLNLTLATACVDLKNFLSAPTSVGKSDVWYQRFLVQNGILFYATWTTVATFINLGVVLTYNFGFSSETVSFTLLLVLGVLAIGWFVLENFFLNAYTEYTFSAYITLIYALAGVFANNYNKNSTIAELVFGLLLMSIALLTTRVLVLIFRKQAKGKKEFS